MSEKILCSINEGIAVVTINRPEVRNAMDKESWALLKVILFSLNENPDVRAVIITGAGDKAFIAGADLNYLRERSVIETLDALNPSVTRTIEKCSKPVIAAINGYALGGGCEVALACDIRIASTKAKLGQTEINVGIIPGAGGTQRLRNLVGMGKAMEMILTGSIIDAEEAYRIGLVNKVTSPETLMDEAMEMARKICQKSPVAVRMAKQAVRDGENLTIDIGQMIEVLNQSVLFSTEDHLEGINAFLEKREPKYNGK